MAKRKIYPFVVHSPGRPEEQTRLRHRISGIYADAVIETLKNSACTAEEKQQILNRILKT